MRYNAHVTYEYDREWVEFINQIKDTATGHSLRMSLASIITNSLVTSAQSIWEKIKDFLTDDCLHRLSLNRDTINPPPSNWTEEQCRYDYGLWLLGDILRDHIRDWVSAYMTGPDHVWVNVESEPNLLVLEALDFDRVEEERQYNSALTSFSPGQRFAFEKIVSTIDNGVKPNTFFLQGPAGTGKTYLYKTLCNKYRSEGKVVPCAALSGIAALLLPKGRTSHSLFNIPINSNEETVGKSVFYNF